MSKTNGGRQSTLLGLWSSSSSSRNAGQSESVAAGAKRKRDLSPPAITSTRSALLLNGNSSQRWENISVPNGPMLLLRGCVGGKKSSERRATREALKTLPDWSDNVTFKIYGKECKMRRRICQFSSGGALSYSYSGLTNVVAPEFPQVLYDIKCQVEDFLCDHILEITKEVNATKHKNLSISPGFVEMLKSIRRSKNDGNCPEIYNYCLCNHYRNGEEYMGYHSDDETSLDAQTPIASITLGISRNFDIRPKKKDSQGKRSRVARIALGDGDLLIMVPPMQSHYEHAIPVEKRVAGERINLTFRRINT